ncbi:MAG: hypothetical protein ABFD07_06270, partial [Methanobacterium sp.]
RINVVLEYADPEEERIARLEEEKIIAKLRMVRVLLPLIFHLLREFFCICDCCERAFSAGHGTIEIIFIIYWSCGWKYSATEIVSIKISITTKVISKPL